MSPLQNTISEGDATEVVHALHKECRCWIRSEQLIDDGKRVLNNLQS
jgi:hypothetical protein